MGKKKKSSTHTKNHKGLEKNKSNDSDERERAFFDKWRRRIRGHGEHAFALRMAWYYALRPWRLGEAFYLLGRKQALEPSFKPSQYLENGKIVDRAVVFGNQVWKFWGGKQMVIPDLAVCSSNKRVSTGISSLMEGIMF